MINEIPFSRRPGDDIKVGAGRRLQRRIAEHARCRSLLGEPEPVDTEPESVAVLMHRLTGVDLTRCPACGEGRMVTIGLVAGRLDSS